MRLAICDDEAAQRRYLQGLVSQWAAIRDIAVSIHAFPSAEAFLFASAEASEFDVLLLDIQMKAMDGVALAKQVRRSNEQLQIIFVTGYPDYIAEGYEVSALHYLVKPINNHKLFEVLDRAVARLQTTPRTILLRKGTGYLRLAADDIYYAEAFSHSVTVYTRDGQQTLSMRLVDMADLLGEGFFRCHRSYIVGMKHVRRVTRAAMVLDNGKEIPLSRDRYDAANQALISL